MPTPSTTSLKLDSELKERVQRLAAARRRSAHWIMREAVEQYVGREEKRERFRQDALAPGMSIKPPACTPVPRKQTPGWPNSKRARTPRPLNATPEVVAAKPARCDSAARFSGSHEL